jgi:ribonuclease BN (tRNA processing enzyme)
MSLRILPLGVGSAFSSRYYGTSCVIQGPGGHILLDCPDPIRKVIREATERSGWSVRAEDLSEVILTHLHGDHSNGLEALGFLHWLQRQQHGFHVSTIKYTYSDVDIWNTHLVPPNTTSLDNSTDGSGGAAGNSAAAAAASSLALNVGRSWRAGGSGEGAGN